MRNLIVLLTISTALAYPLDKAGMPIPYMLVPMLLAIFCEEKRIHYNWKIKWRNWALIPIGYALGERFNMHTCQEIIDHLPGIVSATLLLIAASISYAYYISKRTDINFASSVIGNIPGGLPQMIVLGEEIPQADPNAIIAMQVTRLISTIVTIPFIAMYAIKPAAHQVVTVAQTAHSNFTGFEFLLLASAILVTVYLSIRIKLPTPYMLGAIIAAALMNIFWKDVPEIPTLVMRFAQIFVGIQMGRVIELRRMLKIKKHLTMIISSSLVIIVFCFGVANWLSYKYDYSLATAFLAAAPGGIAEMSIVGMGIGADIATIISYQLFRLIFIYLAVPLSIRWYFKRMES